MYVFALHGVAIGLLGMVATPSVGSILHDTTDSSSVVLVQQGGTGEFGKQGSKSDQPTSGKQSFGGTDQPQSGDFTPNPSASTKTPRDTQDSRGEKGTGKSSSPEEPHQQKPSTQAERKK